MSRSVSLLLRNEDYWSKFCFQRGGRKTLFNTYSFEDRPTIRLRNLASGNWKIALSYGVNCRLFRYPTPYPWSVSTTVFTHKDGLYSKRVTCERGISLLNKFNNVCARNGRVIKSFLHSFFQC